MIARAATQESLIWLEEHSAAVLTRFATGVEVRDERGNIRGVVGFDDAAPSSIRAHMAVDTPMAWRTLLAAALDYAFLQLNKSVLVGTIPAANRRSIRFAKHVGLRETYRIRDGWAPGEDLVVLEMRKEQWLRKAA